MHEARGCLRKAACVDPFRVHGTLFFPYAGEWALVSGGGSPDTGAATYSSQKMGKSPEGRVMGTYTAWGGCCRPTFVCMRVCVYVFRTSWD